MKTVMIFQRSHLLKITKKLAFYHSVNFITFNITRSDHIKRLLLHKFLYWSTVYFIWTLWVTWLPTHQTSGRNFCTFDISSACFKCQKGHLIWIVFTTFNNWDNHFYLLNSQVNPIKANLVWKMTKFVLNYLMLQYFNLEYLLLQFKSK